MQVHRFTYPAILLGTALLIADSVGAQDKRGTARPFDRTVQSETLPGPAAPTPSFPAKASDSPIRTDILGATVYDIDGAEVGEVTGVVNGRAVVAVGRSLGLGASGITLTEDELIQRGIDRRLITTVSRAEIEARAERAPADRR